MKKFISLLLFVCILGAFVPAGAQEAETDIYSKITIPADCELYVGENIRGDWSYNYFVSFKEFEAVKTEENEDGTATYYFDLSNSSDNNIFNYRIWGEEYITRAGIFVNTEDFSMTITEEDLLKDDKTTQDRDVLSNNGCNTADIFLNINKRGHLFLNSGETYTLVPLRRWEIIDTTENNYIIEPDFHFEVKGDSVTVDEKGIITAVEDGTSIVLVTYDAINVEGFYGGSFFGAIHPENTGVFVVTVNGTDEQTDFGIDSELDVVYFTGDRGSFAIDTENEVFVMNPVTDSEFSAVESNDDIPLTEGRNIIKSGDSYQVVTAKKVNITVNNGEPVYPGDSIKVKFDTVYHPIGKLAGTYNPTASILYTTPYGEVVGSKPTLYTFASDVDAQTVSKYISRTEGEEWGSKTVSYTQDGDIVIPEDYEGDVYTLSGGKIVAFGYGDSFGNHRGITYENGKVPEDNYDMKEGFFGVLPDIEIPVIRETEALSGIELITENVKTEYFAGESFDKTNLEAKAVYEDGTRKQITDYTVEPEIIDENTTYVTVSYKGKTAVLPITVKPAEMVSIEVTALPSKLVYNEGETFDPTGMIVTATYNSGKTEELKDYSFSPQRELTAEDTKIIITAGDTESAEIEITVNPVNSGGGGSSGVSVYFTLYGDKKHGDNGTVHTYKNGNLTTWIPKKLITVPSGSTVLDVVIKALGVSGIPYSNPTGVYIESIKNLAQFDNGSMSGWMYILNGSYIQTGIDRQKVRDGDTVIFHYTDDYSKEKSGYSSGGGSAASKPSKKEAELPAAEEETEEKKWYSDAVKYVFENGLMTGLDTGFEPEMNMTRGMLVTVIHRLAGEETAGGTISFADVNESDWYGKSVLWATKKGIINGSGGGLFNPHGYITREELATVLYRYAKTQGRDVSLNCDLSVYADRKEISGWAYEAFVWACAEHITGGISETELAPKSYATRGQIAEMIMKFCEN